MCLLQQEGNENFGRSVNLQELHFKQLDAE